MYCSTLGHGRRPPVHFQLGVSLGRGWVERFYAVACPFRTIRNARSRSTYRLPMKCRRAGSSRNMTDWLACFVLLPASDEKQMLSSIASLFASVGPVAIIGSKFAMRSDPFWAPSALIPVLGMLAGNSLSAMACVCLAAVCLILSSEQNSIELCDALLDGRTRQD
jgi:hypothetical protein